MIAVQVGCDLVEALGRLKVRADAINHTLHDTAIYVLAGMIRFDD